MTTVYSHVYSHVFGHESARYARGTFVEQVPLTFVTLLFGPESDLNSSAARLFGNPLVVWAKFEATIFLAEKLVGSSMSREKDGQQGLLKFFCAPKRMQRKMLYGNSVESLWQLQGSCPKADN